jgi:hypothetical protein
VSGVEVPKEEVGPKLISDEVGLLVVQVNVALLFVVLVAIPEIVGIVLSTLNDTVEVA